MNKIKSFQNLCRVIAILGLGTAVFFTSGCEPLRKKFIRKKKEGDEPAVTVILDPVDYPPVVHSTVDLYRQHYQLWKVWYSELNVVLEEGHNDKKIEYDLEQLRQQMTEMQKLLIDAMGPVMQSRLEELDLISSDLRLMWGQHNKSVLASKLRMLERHMHEHFIPEKVKNKLR